MAGWDELVVSSPCSLLRKSGGQDQPAEHLAVLHLLLDIGAARRRDALDLRAEPAPGLLLGEPAGVPQAEAGALRDLVEEGDPRLLGTAGDRQADQHGEDDRVDDQERGDQRRAPQQLQVLEEQPAHQWPRCRRKRTKSFSGSAVGALGPRPGLAPELLEAAVEDRLTVGEHDEAVAVVARLLDLVGGVDDGGPGLGQACDELPEADALARVEPRAGLVEQQDGGVSDQADRDVDALLVAARERGDGVVATVGQAGLVEHALDDPLDVLDALHMREEPQVLLHREAPVEARLLRHPPDVAVRGRDPARVRPADAGQDREQRRLAGPVRPEHGQQLARRHVEAHVPEGDRARRTTWRGRPLRARGRPPAPAPAVGSHSSPES